ncbi:DUF5605 domain-containing protein [Diaminobutyricibacter sp. McL0608]|uniref:DUF5605 domain-containing protein n=1 Tax=Leifsonia sp. McL0608 TaxID=3143537 RepID=UPI0031F2E869
MAGFTEESLLIDLLDNPRARGAVQRALPGVLNSPMLTQLRYLTIGQITTFGLERVEPSEIDRLWQELAAIDADAVTVRVEEPAIEPRTDYETDAVARGSARSTHPELVARWGVFELLIDGPSHGNPFVDVELTATFARAASDGGEPGDTADLVRVGGFYDGDGLYRVRFLPESVGDWTYTTTSTARSLDGLSGSFAVTPPDAGNAGPVRVADTFHFAYADGTRYLPIGTTAYAWTHQPESLQQATLDTLATSPFTKLRMCVFPKSYLYNTNDPEVYPFVRREDGSFDTTRFDPAYFALLEQRILQLAELGIEADLILFHAYDRWGFSELGHAADDRYVRYLVRRLGAYRSVWWSLANEYDLLWSKTVDDWERLADLVVAEDPARHLLSIHNCLGFYDYSRPWITHASVQRIDVYRTSENTDAWREQWGKPVVIDECAYEGDIDQGWGNITGEELTRRFWEGAVRGGYVGHGETYLNDREELWWSKGGELVGSSPQRIRFLAELVAESPSGVLDPLPGEWDLPWGGVAGEYLIAYFGFNRPTFRMVTAPRGRRYTVDVIDTWAMTVSRLDGVFEGTFRVPLPARQYMAVRLVAADAPAAAAPAPAAAAADGS